MGKSPYKKIAKGDMKGWVKEELIDLLPPNFFQDPVPSVKGIGGEIIAESKWRWAGLFTLPEGKGVFLKRDRTKGWMELLKYLVFPSKGRKEWFIAYQLGKRNLNIPRPMGWMERVHRGWVKESYYLSEAVESGAPLSELTHLLKDGRISSELVKMITRMHASGLLHKDLHAGNFLWDGVSFYLTDLHRARILKSLSLNQKLWNLAHLFHSLRLVWGEEDQVHFLGEYFVGEHISPEKKRKYLHKIHFWMDRLQRRQWQSRTKRCLKESTEFSVKKEKGITIYLRNDLSLDRLKKVIESHLTFVREKPSDLLKNSPEVKVSLVEDGKGKVYVKQFCYPHFWDCMKDTFRFSKGLKAWSGGNGLRARGITSPKTLALMERKRGLALRESFLVMESSVNGLEMDRYILKGFGDFQRKRRFIKAFAKWLSHLHKKDLYHRDMKTCNILVSENGDRWEFFLIDLEDVLLDEKVNEKILFRNFLQLNTSIPNFLTRTERLRFFKTYHEQHPILRNEKEFLRRLIDESKKRGIIYVSSQGVIQEEYR
jgi:tRNA A-37 threonylcarbamoyl transferase component Bud32